MAILNTQIQNIGQSGVAPSFIYLETNNTMAEVTVVGFLNDLVNQGLPIAENQMALVSTKLTPHAKSTQTALYNVVFAGGYWSLVQTTGNAWLLGGNSSSESILAFGTNTDTSISFQANHFSYFVFDTSDNSLFIDPAIIKFSNIPSTTTSNILYIDPSTRALSFGLAGSAGSGWLLDGTNGGSGLIFGTNSADGWDYQVNGSTFATVSSVGDTTWTGGALFSGDFNVTSADTVHITSSGNDTIIDSVTGTARLVGAFIDIIATVGNASLRSDTGNTDVFCNSGHLNLHGATATFSADTQIDMFVSGGNIQINTNTGNFNVFAGAGPTPGAISLGATDTINIFTNTDDININAATGADLNISGDGGNASWGMGTGGLGGGISAGSGCSFALPTGNVSFGASTGTFLLGALANSVDILAGTIMTLSAATKLDFESAAITMPLITDQAPVVAAPTISLPVGYKYLIINDTTGQVYKMG